MGNPNDKTEAEKAAAAQAAAQAAAEAKAKAKADKEVIVIDDTWYVLDTTAKADTMDEKGNVIRGSRTHQQMIGKAIKNFTFAYAEPLPLPSAIAVKFLKNEGFVRTDKDGNPVEYKRLPKQPDQLGAGEALRLELDETVARVDELSNPALFRRVMEMPGGEKFAEGKPTREALIEFIITHKKVTQKANQSKVSDRVVDGYEPEADLEDAA